MASITLKLKGADELAKKLREMPIKLEKQALQESVLQALDAVLPEMINAAPVHMDEQSPFSKKYGTTRENMRVVKLKRAGRNFKGGRLDTGNALQGFLFEIGSRHQPARPWFAPKIRSLAQKVVDVFAMRVGEAIEDLWEKK